SAAPTVIEARTISHAWAHMAVRIADHKGKVISPLVLTIANKTADAMLQEDADLRRELDVVLNNLGEDPIDIVAFTIFPDRYLTISDGDRTAFFELYADTFPRLQAMTPRLNGRGLYFQRLTMFEGAPCKGNQLEWIIQQYTSRDRI